MQIEWYTYEHDIWTREIPAGRERAAQGMAPKLAGRVLTAEAAASARVLRGEARSNPFTKVVSFPSHGETCAAWHLTGEGDAFAGERGRPCVVMAHGFGGTKDSGLLPFAEAFAEAASTSCSSTTAASGSRPASRASSPGPPATARTTRPPSSSPAGLDGVDPERIVLWGTSWSGGHVVYVAAEDPRIAADRSARRRTSTASPRLQAIWPTMPGSASSSGSTCAGSRTLCGCSAGEEPLMIPIGGRPGSWPR